MYNLLYFPVFVLGSDSLFTMQCSPYLKYPMNRMTHIALELDLTGQNTEGFPDSSVGKESSCNAVDPSSIPGSGRSPGEGIGYPLLHSWASVVAQMVKNLLAVRETWVQSMGWGQNMVFESHLLSFNLKLKAYKFAVAFE